MALHRLCMHSTMELHPQPQILLQSYPVVCSAFERKVFFPLLLRTFFYKFMEPRVIIKTKQSFSFGFNQGAISEKLEGSESRLGGRLKQSLCARCHSKHTIDSL